MYKIKLTKFQADAVEWAIDAMAEFWDGYDNPAATDEELPKLKGRMLTLSNRADVADDLAYRMEIQLVDMVCEEYDNPAAQVRSLKALGEKIKTAVPRTA